MLKATALPLGLHCHNCIKHFAAFHCHLANIYKYILYYIDERYMHIHTITIENLEAAVN